MDRHAAVTALSALAHLGRLDVCRLLIQAGPQGMAAGEIARATGNAPSTLSTHLSLLAIAGLVTSTRRGRSIIYAAAYDRMSDLLAFLMEDCCAGKPEICAPLAAITERAACCA
jgi:DNA-binding transcriptional ArsR family regulator